MPLFLIPYLVAGLGGAFVGSVVNTSVSTPAQATNDQLPSAFKMAMYAAAAVGVVHIAKKVL